jgi:hypothetical protein
MIDLQGLGRSIVPSIILRLRRKPKTLASVIWAHFVGQPGFREEIRQAMVDLREGRAVPLKEITRDR